MVGMGYWVVGEGEHVLLTVIWFGSDELFAQCDKNLACVYCC